MTDSGDNGQADLRRSQIDKSRRRIVSCSARMAPVGTDCSHRVRQSVCCDRALALRTIPRHLRVWFRLIASAPTTSIVHALCDSCGEAVDASGTTFAADTRVKRTGYNPAACSAAEQERIVAAIEEQFSRLDAGVAALERARQNLKRMRAAVLQAAVRGDWFHQDRTMAGTSIVSPSECPPGKLATRNPTAIFEPIPSRLSSRHWRIASQRRSPTDRVICTESPCRRSTLPMGPVRSREAT